MTEVKSTAYESFKLLTGDVFHGECIRSDANMIVPQGQGTLLLASGDLFVGQFASGKRIHGKVLYSSGSVYEGGFDSEERPSGQGLYRWPDGRVYRGFLLKGRPHGPGIYEGFLPSSTETFFSGISASGSFSSLAQQDCVARFLAEYEAEFTELARTVLHTLASDLDALIPGGSSDLNSLAPGFIAKHLLAVDSAVSDPWTVGGIGTDAVTKVGANFVTLRQLRLRIPVIRKLAERANAVSVRCMQTPPTWGIEQMRGFGQVLEISDSEITLRFVNVSRVPGSIELKLAEVTGEAITDEATVIATIFNEKKKKK